MSAAAAPIALIAAGAGVALGAFGSLVEGEQQATAAEAASRSQAAALKTNAAIADRQAQLAREQAAQERRRAIIEAEAFQREARRRQGKAIAGFGASGIQLTGSALNVLHDIALSDAQTQLLVRAEGEQRAYARLVGASIEEMSSAEFMRQAAAEREVGRYTAGAARTASYFSAGSTLLTGAAQVGLMASQLPTAPSTPSAPSTSLAGGRLNRSSGLYGRN